MLALLFALLFLMVGCTPSPEDQLLQLLETRYANLHVNHPEHKKAVIAKLRPHLQRHRLSSETLPNIQKILSELGDGHVQLKDTAALQGALESGLTFHVGTQRIRSCEGCIPTLPEGDYTIAKVNELTADEWARANRWQVSASTAWGREFRLWRLLERSLDDTPLTLELRDSKGKKYVVAPQWKLPNPEADAQCVSGERLAPDEYRINLRSLWCESPTMYTRKDILKRFRLQWEEAITPIRPSDKIILDLRENSGGGDEETIHVLSTFIAKSVPLFHYKYLQTTRPGFMRFIVQATRPLWPLWTEEEKQQLNPRPMGKTLHTQELTVLIGAGCFSSCEVVADVLQNAKRGRLLGSTTHGAAGEPRDIPIDGTRFVLTLPSCLVWKTDGQPYEGEGVVPLGQRPQRHRAQSH